MDKHQLCYCVQSLLFGTVPYVFSCMNTDIILISSILYGFFMMIVEQKLNFVPIKNYKYDKPDRQR